MPLIDGIILSPAKTAKGAAASLNKTRNRPTPSAANVDSFQLNRDVQKRSIQMNQIKVITVHTLYFVTQQHKRYFIYNYRVKSFLCKYENSFTQFYTMFLSNVLVRQNVRCELLLLLMYVGQKGANT